MLATPPADPTKKICGSVASLPKLRIRTPQEINRMFQHCPKSVQTQKKTRRELIEAPVTVSVSPITENDGSKDTSHSSVVTPPVLDPKKPISGSLPILPKLRIRTPQEINRMFRHCPKTVQTQKKPRRKVPVAPPGHGVKSVVFPPGITVIPVSSTSPIKGSSSSVTISKVQNVTRAKRSNEQRRGKPEQRIRTNNKEGVKSVVFPPGITVIPVSSTSPIKDSSSSVTISKIQDVTRAKRSNEERRGKPDKRFLTNKENVRDGNTTNIRQNRRKATVLHFTYYSPDLAGHNSRSICPQQLNSTAAGSRLSK